MRMEILEGPDREGKYHYALLWMADYHPGHPLGENRIAERAQHFRAFLPTRKLDRIDDLRRSHEKGQEAGKEEKAGEAHS
jgi:hypothetical protein